MRTAFTAIASLAGFLTAALPAASAPPPPALVPERLARPVDGYDSAALYQQWRYWIERQKGPVTEALLSKPEALGEVRAFGGPLLVFKKTGDLGHFLTGEIRAYCRPNEPYGFVPGSCRYRLRRAYIPHDAANGDNPVGRWAQETFDPAGLAAHLRRSGVTPDTDWWRADHDRLFAASPSPREVLARNATLVTLDSADCPGLGRAMAALDRRVLGWRLDMPWVGEDAELIPPPPHATNVSYTLDLRIPGQAGFARLEGSGEAFDALIGPVLDAADACERAGRAA